MMKPVLLPPKASVSAAVFFALYGAPHLASAQQQPASTQQQSELQPSTLQEVVVTASRRQQTLAEVPYSLSVVGAEQIANTGVTDIASLASQVPGLSVYNFGARASGEVYPVIRGLNASAAGPITGPVVIRTFEQSPVGTYIGNSPIDGYFQLDDVQRVEVLRGPQGTLYGAGALGGALRIIPNAPELDKFAGDVEASGGTLAHSSGTSYTTSAMFNIPVGDALAFRVSGKYAYEPGFINAYGILDRTGPPLSAIPVLADPSDPANSPGILTAKKDWNDQNTFTGRASLLWKPTDKFNADLAFVYANANGDSGPLVDPDFPGGPYPLDRRITFPRGGDYQRFSGVDEPWSRRTILESLDLSFDAGFATISSTSSYYTTNGSTISDGTYLDASFPAAVGYYAGNPANPRFIIPVSAGDTAHTFTQEVRLVSTTGPHKLFDYVVGVFYENQRREGTEYISNPGSPEYSVAEGCTAPYFLGASFPDCLVTSGPGDATFQQTDIQHFQDKSEFGELTWHFTSHGQITFGGRHFEQSFTDVQSYLYYTFGIFVPAASVSSAASKDTWKINSSYEYATHQYVYALWSQGFRRGGANAIPINTGTPFSEMSPLLASYAPDSVNNYEMGLKGRFPGGLSYTFDVFDIEWNKPQVEGITPAGNSAVWNANKAESTGAEFDLHSPLFLPGLSITAGAAYANARFTQNYFIAADTFGNIFGQAGQQLPGSPKTSAAVTLNYERTLAPEYKLAVSLNDTYRSAMYLSTFGVLGGTPTHVSGMQLANASASVTHNAWLLGVYVTNVADKRVILVPPNRPNYEGNLTNDYLINQPREIELRLGYSF